MELTKLTVILFLSGFHHGASKPSHGIPVEGYATELQELGQHVEIPEPPVKVIKITKTIAIKVPVPYPVKVPHRVPYPVTISKHIPIPVPHFVKVPHPVVVKDEKNDAPLIWPPTQYQEHGVSHEEEAPQTHQVYEDISEEGHGEGPDHEQQGHDAAAYSHFLPVQVPQHGNQQSYAGWAQQPAGAAAQAHDEGSWRSGAGATGGAGAGHGYDNVVSGYLQHLQGGAAGEHSAPFTHRAYLPELNFHHVKQVESSNVDHLNY